MNLETEILCGYEVPAQMKRIWAMELEIVERFVAICSEYSLEYRIMGGTLLGAVRHKGFIPWDNDIDIIMPRKDFNFLLDIGPTVFDDPFFFQTPVTEKSRYFCTYAKVRNGKGTAASRNDFENGINCGVFIDVFCLDEIPNSLFRRRLYFKRINEIAKMHRFYFHKELNKGWINVIKHYMQRIVYRFVYGSPNAAEVFMIYQNAAGRYAGKNRKQVAHQAFGYHKNFIWEKKDWEAFVLLRFEHILLKAPIGFDAILKRQYGDYMMIPNDKSTHDYIEFNPDISYREFFSD